MVCGRVQPVAVHPVPDVGGRHGPGEIVLPGESDADRAYSAGANLYMVKPADPALLTETAQMLTGVEMVR